MKLRASLNISRLASLPLGVAGKQRLAILIYHRILESHDFMRPHEPTRKVFDWHMRAISRHFTPLGLHRALELMDAGTLPDGAVCVTFDDGYADNERIALPILQKWGVPATVFVASGFLDGGRMWNDTVIEVVRRSPAGILDPGLPDLSAVELGSEASRCNAAQSIISRLKYQSTSVRTAVVERMAEKMAERMAEKAIHLPDDLMLSTEALRKLHHSGIEIGGHTRHHPILASLDAETALREIKTGKDDLEQKLDSALRYFAYPNGRKGKDYNAEHVEMVKGLGFAGAVSTHWGVSSPHCDPWQRARFTPWDKSSGRFMLRLLMNYRKLEHSL